MLKASLQLEDVSMFGISDIGGKQYMIFHHRQKIIVSILGKGVSKRLPFVAEFRSKHFGDNKSILNCSDHNKCLQNVAQKFNF